MKVTLVILQYQDCSLVKGKKKLTNSNTDEKLMTLIIQ